MSLRAPSHLAGSAAEAAFDALGHEILAEKAAALGRAGQRVEDTLARFRQGGDDVEQRPRLLKDAAEAVHGYFIQRELCGLRKHDAIIREYDIPKAVLARLGAK